DVRADPCGADVRLYLFGHRLREVARGGARVREELLLVERLRQLQSLRRREGVANVRRALQRSQVVQKRRLLARGLLRDRLDRARLPFDLPGDRLGLLPFVEATAVFTEPAAAVLTPGRAEVRDDLEVVGGDEVG